VTIRIATKRVCLLCALCIGGFACGRASAQEAGGTGNSSIRQDLKEEPKAEGSQEPGQEANPVLKHRPAKDLETRSVIRDERIELTVPQSEALHVVLNQEERVRGVGQLLRGHLIEPVYAFDRMVLPVGTEVSGKITNIEGVSGGRRTLAALDADFTPARQITVEFDELTMPDGKRIPIETRVAPGSGRVIRFVAAAENQKKKGVKDALTEKERQAKQDARRQFTAAMQNVKEPGRLRRLWRYGEAQLPVRYQYIDAGTLYFAELGKPLEFGSEPLTPEVAAAMKSEIPAGTTVHAQLMTSLNSATTPRGAEVEAELTRPLVSDGKLILPEGSVLKGSVVQVQRAGHWKHNGQLRFVFRDLLLPNGVESKVEAMVQGVQSGKIDNLQLDSEGGAETKTPNTRYLKSSVAIGLAAATHEDEVLNRAEGGADGFKLVGLAVGALVHSQPLAIAMGALGASRSLYNNFIARGTEVAFAKHTAMEIEIDTRGAGPAENPGAARGKNAQ
jgi:hypothetical protein